MVPYEMAIREVVPEAEKPLAEESMTPVWLRTTPVDYMQHKPYVTGEVYAVRIEGEPELFARPDIPEQYKYPLMIELPAVAARGLYDFFYWHKQPTTRNLPGRNFFNCHWFTALCRGWVQPDELDPNIIGSGGVHVASRDELDHVEAGLPAGSAVGIMHSSFPRRFIHSGITLAAPYWKVPPSFLSVESWGGPLVMGRLERAVKYYADDYGGFPDRAFTIVTRPQTLDTDNWRVRAARQAGSGADGDLSVAAFDEVIVAKRVAHAAFLSKNGIVAT